MLRRRPTNHVYYEATPAPSYFPERCRRHSGLPLLEAMIPAGTALAQTAAAPPPRFMGIFFPHGLAYSHWEMTEGPLDKMSYIMEPLTPVKDRTVVSGWPVFPIG